MRKTRFPQSPAVFGQTRRESGFVPESVFALNNPTSIHAFHKLCLFPLKWTKCCTNKVFGTCNAHQRIKWFLFKQELGITQWEPGNFSRFWQMSCLIQWMWVTLKRIWAQIAKGNVRFSRRAFASLWVKLFCEVKSRWRSGVYVSLLCRTVFLSNSAKKLKGYSLHDIVLRQFCEHFQYKRCAFYSHVFLSHVLARNRNSVNR